MTENTTASGAADLTAEIECDCLVAWNRSEFGANQHDTVHPMYLAAFKSGYKAALAASAPVAPTMVDMVPPATSRDRWMYEQGRLAERDPRTSKAAPVAPAPQPVHLDLDRVLSIADVHAEESREDGVRLMDRGGLNAFASDIIRVSQGQPEASSQSAQIVELATQLRKDALTIFDDDVHDVIEWFYGSLLAAASKAAPAPQPAAPQGDVAAWLVLADGEPHHVTPGKSDEAARLWAEEQTKCGAPYNFTFLPLCPPAAPKAAPAINKGSDIIDAYGMTPGQPERVADIPGLAEALEAAFADGSAQVTGATPLQQGKYPAFPKPVARIDCGDADDGGLNWWGELVPDTTHTSVHLGQRLFTEMQMREVIDSDRAARGAAQAAPASPYHDGVNIESLQRACRAFGLRTDDSLEAFVSPDVHAEHVNRLTRAVIKYVLTRPAQPAPVAEDAIALLSEVAHYFKGDDDLPNDLLQRIDALLDAQAAQPEGGAKP